MTDKLEQQQIISQLQKVIEELKCIRTSLLESNDIERFQFVDRAVNQLREVLLETRRRTL